MRSRISHCGSYSGSRTDEEYRYKPKSVKSEKAASTPAADATPHGASLTPSHASLVGAQERSAVSALMGLPRTATSPMRPLAPPALPLLAGTPASATPAAADAFATPLPLALAPPLQHAPPPLSASAVGASAPPDVRAEAALQTALNQYVACMVQLADAEKQLEVAETTLESAKRVPAVEARAECRCVAVLCVAALERLSAAVATANLAMERLVGDSWTAAQELVSLKVPKAQAHAAALVGRAAAGESKATAALARYDPAQHEGSLLDLSYADGVLDDMTKNLTSLETMLQALPEGPAPKKLKATSTASAAVRAALVALGSVEGDKITSHRRMLHLKQTAASARSPTYWRGLSERDEKVLEAVLPIDNAEANAAFTRMVNQALAAHKSKHKAAPPSAMYEVALMWTDPLAVALRQLAHLDALFGQTISVTALSRMIDAFVVLDGAPELSADQVLRGLGLADDDMAWAEQHMPFLLTKAKEYGVLPFPELCEPFMVDVVEPGASRFRAVRTLQLRRAPPRPQAWTRRKRRLRWTRRANFSPNTSPHFAGAWRTRATRSASSRS